MGACGVCVMLIDSKTGHQIPPTAGVMGTYELLDRCWEPKRPLED